MIPALLLFLAANYTTYLGGSAADTTTAIAVDYAGAIYVAGTTTSPNFPVTSTALGAPLASFISVDGSSIVCSAPTYGGILASDGTDNIYSAGVTYTYRTSIATPGAFQTTYQGGDNDVVVQASAASLCFHAAAR
jgi:hypothetical protein